MLNQSKQSLVLRCTQQLYVAVLALSFLPSIAIAGIQVNTIDPAAVLAENDRHLSVSGPIACTQGQHADIEVTITQRQTGAVAFGRTRVLCTGYIQHWEARAKSHGKNTFQVGQATAVAMATTSTRGTTDDAHQWLVNITVTN